MFRTDEQERRIKKLKRVAKKMKANGYYVEVRSDYSGREMFGRTCYGIVTDNVDIVIDAKISTTPLIDHMGLNYIVYFPYLTGDK